MPNDTDRAPSRDFTAASRDALVEALLSAGPGQPTLCEGWQTQHLAAHIVLREGSPLVAGLVVKPLQSRLERRTMDLGDSAATPEAYQDLVARISAGPSAGRRLAERLQHLPAVRRAAQATNLLEFYVHTEDVRRAQHRWAPRHLAEEYADALFTELARSARLRYRSEDTGIVLARSTGQRVVARRPGPGEPSRTISGPAGELVMHAFGRRDNALVVVD
ncbi:TIGR03085 family metal-binding protein [Citricoccus sp.]|uniref:TIGR03085 family metal-binding protein n=1 Tax=Citricoccus sp. TaxID=1978372 RepID=UPI002639E6F3|nr:TIGR03085 family metal-binding protein [Citricoccus sp.]HRO29089.1 TIGR03085 family metal-binding protein [Citricoccus sp.]HRO95212.1 TIGR03085 family metal-binding protein [Citricoccus sp.]